MTKAVVNKNIYKEAQTYYARMEDLLKGHGFPGLDRDDIIDLMVIFHENMSRENIPITEPMIEPALLSL